MLINDNWFTKALLVQTLARAEKTQAQQVNKTSGNDNLFSTILNQMLQMQEMGEKQPHTSAILPTEIQWGNESFSNTIPYATGKGATLFNESLRFSSVSADKINSVLDGKLAGMGEAFVQAGQQYNIDPALLTAIAQHETGNGKSRAAIEKNNIAGMMGKTGLKSYSSVQESIMDMARNLSKNYLGQGIASISEIGAKYAPIAAKNDPTGLNNHWVSGVSGFYEKVKV